MQLHEFAQRTGYTPTYREYCEVIEPAYYAHPFDKDSFCHDWLVEECKRCHEVLNKFDKQMRSGIALDSTSKKLYRQTAEQLQVFSQNLITLNEKIYGK